jgi:hypothetical protein
MLPLGGLHGKHASAMWNLGTNSAFNLPIIKESQIQIYVYLYSYLFIYAFIPSTCYTWFGAYPNHMHIIIIVKVSDPRG